MKQRPRLVSRVALFAALVYVFSWGTSYLPNVNFVFFIVFSAGFLWGYGAGMLVGAIGMGLWTMFNPYGPAMLPVMLAQVIGAAGAGVVGAWFRGCRWHLGPRWIVGSRLLLASLFCTVLYYLPVSVVDAWTFGPFRERFLGGLLWSGFSLGFNVVIFPLLFRVTLYLHARERAVR